MVQEVQQQGNRYQAPHEIESIWLSKRKVSDHTQVREKWTNGCYASTTISVPYRVETKNSSWTITGDDRVKYTAYWGKLYIPLAWTYMIKFQLPSNYNQTYTEIFRIYNWKKEVYKFTTTLADKAEHEITLDFGKKNEVSVSLYLDSISGNILQVNPKLQIIKL